MARFTPFLSLSSSLVPRLLFVPPIYRVIFTRNTFTSGYQSNYALRAIRGANTNLIISGSKTCYPAHVRIGASTETEDAYQKLICERLHKYSGRFVVEGEWVGEKLSTLPRDVSSFLAVSEKRKGRGGKGRIRDRLIREARGDRLYQNGSDRERTTSLC